jgi:hypothetical protein
MRGVIDSTMIATKEVNKLTVCMALLLPLRKERLPKNISKGSSRERHHTIRERGTMRLVMN